MRPRTFILLFVGIAALACGGFALGQIPDFTWHKLFAATYRGAFDVLCRPVIGLIIGTIFSFSFWAAIVLTLGLQVIIPARSTQKLFSIGLGQDLVWFFYETVLHSLIFLTYIAFLIRYYQIHFSWLTITSLNQTPGWIRFLLALLILDFLYWAQHYFIHKVPLLWEFHKVHHSQNELNFFADFRYHVFEYLVRYTFLVVPFLIFKVDAPVVVTFAIFQRWYPRFYHGNIRTNLGPLRYILVTPQSHRVHHSLEAAHRDKNFGAIFSIWDFAFGTQCKSFEAYPETGIEDEAFPRGQTLAMKTLLVTPLYQLLHPVLIVSNQVRTLGNRIKLQFHAGLRDRASKQ